MKIVKTINGLKKEIRKVKLARQTIGFIPTMGALHKGHLRLMRKAHKDNDFVIVSIFVNPAQFGPKEDFKKYPRNLKNDARLCKSAGVNLIFCPSAKEIYPEDFKTFITVQGLSDVLCGKSRPGHFRGVATVVIKLFNLVGPDTAYFGQKDAQQTVIIKKLVKDLNVPVRIKVVPTVRENNGLALSSRNAYLNPKERAEARVLFTALKSAVLLAKSGEIDSGKIIKKISQLIKSKNKAKIDYIAVVDPDNLKPLKIIKGNCLIALAVRIGKTRLIDNIIC